MQGAKVQGMPVASISRAAALPTFSASSGLRVQPMPMLCGNTVAPLTKAFPWTASVPQMIGMPRRVPSARVCIEATSLTQFWGALGSGSEVAPLSTEPTCSLRTSSVFFASFQSIWVICPTFSSSVILLSSSSMSGVGTLARLAASLPGDGPEGIPTQPSTARRATSRERRAPEAGMIGGRVDCIARDTTPGGARAGRCGRAGPKHM